MKRKKCLELFLAFFKIGLFTFGGGYAMISIIEDICVERKGWITHDDMMNVTVLAESTPGPIAINCATFVGYQHGGLSGAAAATLGVVLPSLVIIYAISMFLDHFLEITLIANAFRGIKIAVGILILRAALNSLRKMEKTPLALGVAGGACVAMLLINFFSWNFSSISLILIAGALGFAVYALGKRSGTP